jgi:hypothetical protein
MAHNEQTTTLSFLTDAAHLLATTAPETSAYLMSRRNELMFEHEMPLSDKQRHHVCTCCGHIMLLGKGSRLQVKSEIRPSKKNKSRSIGSTGPPHNPGPTKAITCGHCGRLTNIKLPAPAPISRRKVKVEKVTKTLGASGPSTTAHAQAQAHAQETASQKASSNASSKKRAKSRKAGLQALLDQSSASRNSRPGGLGLSLADFMAK